MLHRIVAVAAVLAMLLMLSACGGAPAESRTPLAPTDASAVSDTPAQWDGRPSGYFRQEGSEPPRVFNILPTENGYLSMFIHQYRDEELPDSEPIELRGAVIEGRMTDDGTVLFECPPETFRITPVSADELRIDAAGGEETGVLSGRYCRVEGALTVYSYTPAQAPAYRRDAHCAVEMDDTLAAAVREQLELAADTFLDEATLGTLEELTVFDRPITSIKGISALRDLRRLCINRGYITDIGELAALPLLEQVDISWCYITAIPDLSACPHLRELRLARNLITDLTPLNTVPWLQMADVGDNRVRSAAPVAGHEGLRTLVLDNNAITDYAALTDHPAIQKAISAGSTFTYAAALETEKLAQSIVAEVTAGMTDPLEKEAALYRYVIDHTEFATGTYHENAYGERALKTHRGVCGNYAEAFSLLCNHAGIEACVCNSDDHAWVLVTLNGRCYHCDALWDEDHEEWEYFNRGTGFIMNQESHGHDLLRYGDGWTDMNPLAVYHACFGEK